MKINDINIEGLTYDGLVVKFGPYWRHKFEINDDFSLFDEKDAAAVIDAFIKDISSKTEVNRVAITMPEACSYYGIQDFINILYNNGVRDIWIHIDDDVRDVICRSSFSYINCDDNYRPLADLQLTFVFGKYQSENHAMVIDDKYITPAYRASFNQQIWQPAGPGYINITSKIDPNQKIWKNSQHN